MRTRALVLITLLGLPGGASGQRLPRVPRRNPTPAAPLPPEAPAVERALAYKRSRWSFEAYPLINFIQMPTGGGGMMSYTTSGTGTHADYRYTDSFAATIDLTASFFGGPAITETGEVGTRFRPLPWSPGLRPFVDVRAGFTHTYDTYAFPRGTNATTGTPSAEGGRYSRGVGGIVGAGLEFSITNAWALTTEMLAMRNRMSTYRLTQPASAPMDGNYWSTGLRYTLGLKFSPVRALHLAQNPSS